MKIVIEKDKITNIDDININSGSIRYYRIDFEFDETWTDLTKKVVIINRMTEQAKEFAIIDNHMFLDVFENGDYSIGVVGYTLNEENEKEYQISTNLRMINIKKGSGQIKAIENEIPTLSEWETYINQIQELCNGVVIKNIEEEIDGLNHNFTINYTNGTSFKFTIKDGENASSEGTSDYNDLDNKPQINGVPLEGNKTSEDFGIKQEYTANDITFEDGETFQQKYDNGELKGEKGEPGPQGEPGIDGEPGPQGNPGPAGVDGENGFSPTVTTTSIENGTKIDITDVNGVKSFEVLNGKDGKDGEQGVQGEPGQNGADGQDGFSPTVITTPISNGTKVSITDKTGTKEFDVMNGERGLQGEKGEDGADGKTPVKGIDYFTEQDKQEFIEEVEQTLTPKLDNKLDKNQGAENSGKFLGIGADGLVVPKDVPSTGGGDNNYLTVINEVNVEEEVAVVKIDFTGDYDNYYVIGQLQNGDTGTIIIYQDARDILGKTISLKFLDTYGNNNKTITFALRFERIKGENNNLLRLSGLYTNASYIPSNKMTTIDTGYFEKYTTGDFLQKYTGIKIKGQFLSGSLKILGGN